MAAHQAPVRPLALPRMPQTKCQAAGNRAATNREDRRVEPLSPIYSAAGSHVPADASDSACWILGLHATAGFCIARGGLPHHTGGDVLSGCEPGRYGFGRNRTARETVWAGAGVESDDLDELRRKLDHRFAVCSGTKH